jgi:hypothetical protein
MTNRIKPFIVTVVALAASALTAAETSWWSFTGGGGISQHGSVALGGAIGPIAPSLAPATGGNYTLSGGFWTALSGQPQPVWPVLKIKWLADKEKVLISWPVNLNGFKLEYTTNLVSGVWYAEDEPVVDTESEHTVAVPPPGVFRCYRLRSE